VLKTKPNEMVIVVWSPFVNPLVDSWLTRKNASIHLSLFSCSDSIMVCLCNVGFSIGGLVTESLRESRYATEKCVSFINIHT